jgi:hypothetical protein
MNENNAVVDVPESVHDVSEKDDEAPADTAIMLLGRNGSEETSRTFYTAHQFHETPLRVNPVVSSEMEPQQSAILTETKSVSVLGSLSVSTFMPSSSLSWVHWVKTNHGNGGPGSVSDMSESVISEMVDDIDLGDYDTLNQEREGWYMTQHRQPPTKIKSLMMGGMDDFMIMAKRATKLFSGDMLLPALDESSNNSSGGASRIYFDAEQLSI